MAETGGAIASAEARLRAALDSLEAAVDRQVRDGVAAARLRAEADALADDRAQLAAQLDDAVGDAARAKRANQQVVGRIDAAIGAIRAVLDKNRAG